MDRQIAYTGALPQTTDILSTNKFSMQGLAYALHGVLGVTTVVEGLQCTPTPITADLNIHVNVGSIYSMNPTDSAAYGDLGIDTASIVKQGINAVAKTLAITPPLTGGFSQVFLVQAIYNDVDAGASVLSYFNAANPAAPYSGPANNGMSQFTTRTGVCVIALKAGVAATTGAQTTPSPDAGYTGLYAVTVANGQTQITAGNIVQLTSAPFFPTLPAVPPDVQTNLWTYAVDSSAGGAPPATTATTSTGSAVLTFGGGVPAYVAAGMKVFDLTTVGAITGGQTVLSKTGTTVTMTANANATVGSGDLIAFSNNAIVATILPPPAGLVPGLECVVKLAGTNSGTTTLNLNGLGAVAVHRGTGASLAAGDLPSGMICRFVYDGTSWQVENFTASGSGAISFSTVGIPYCVDTSTVMNSVVAPFNPTISSLTAGLTVEVKLANINTGAATITVNALGPVAIVDTRLQPLTYGALWTGMVALLIYDGTQFQLANKATVPLQANTTFYVSNNTSGGVLGSDTAYDGTSATISGTHGPWLTLQGATNNIARLNLNGYIVTVNVSNGTYASMDLLLVVFNGTVNYVGNIGTPANCIITTAIVSDGCFAAYGKGSQYTINGFKVTAPNGYGIVSQAGSSIFFANIDFGVCNEHMLADAGDINCFGNYTISGSAQIHIGVISGGSALLDPNPSNVVTILGVPNFSQAFAFVRELGYIRYKSTCTFSGVATGTRYSISTNGVIQTGGLGASYLPGNLPGATFTGGVYA